MKVLDVTAMDGGPAKLPSHGVIRLLPLEENSGDFALTMRIVRKERDGTPSPVVVARGSDGEARFIELELSRNQRSGFLTRESEYEFRQEIRQSPGDERLKAIRNSRLEVYWAEFRGVFAAKLPPPE